MTRKSSEWLEWLSGALALSAIALVVGGLFVVMFSSWTTVGAAMMILAAVAAAMAGFIMPLHLTPEDQSRGRRS
jgi:uncharacterized membrane-anchored protein